MKQSKKTRTRRETRPSEQNGLDDLPVEVAVVIEENSARKAAPVSQPAKPGDASLEDLVARLTAIRERLFWLQAIWATTLSHDVYQEADRYGQLFHDLGEQLKAKTPDELDRLIAGHEALLLAEPISQKPTLSLATQRWFELAAEIRDAPAGRHSIQLDGYVADGLQSFLRARTMAYITPVERIYRELAYPKAPDTKPSPVAAKKAELSRDDVCAILQRKSSASAEQLQQILSDERKYKLSRSERDQLSLDLTIAIAQARQNNDKPDNPNARFIAQVLGQLDTPFGLIERSFVDDLLRAGSQNIAQCRRHQPPKCECWSAQRAILWQAQSSNGDKSPEAWAARRIYEALEDLELSSRPSANT
jgi:hypothetical protein